MSDTAGSGKSWTMKNFRNILGLKNPTNWISFVDLKGFVKDFKKVESLPEFSTFMSENFLKSKQNFEKQIFQKFYKTGKAFIFFDGFDEIAPDYAKIVLRLAESFKFNEGNQLWISTRNYFTIDLQNEIKFDLCFSLCNFTEEDGINMIVSSWILKEIQNKVIINSKDEFIDYVKNSPSYKSYQKTAKEIINKIAMTEYRSVGLPQLFNMVAEIFKNSTNQLLDINNFKIYEIFVQNLYKRWAEEKGQLRKKANTESQRYEQNFWKFHQYMAIKILFPELVIIFFKKYNGKEWSDEEIIACGIMGKNPNYYFLHKTFCEFFVADLIVKAIQDDKLNQPFIKLIIKVLTVKKFEVICMFLNDAIVSSVLLKVHDKMLNVFNYSLIIFEKDVNLSLFFTKNLDNLVDSFLKLLESSDYKIVRSILNKNVWDVVENTKIKKMFLNFKILFLIF
ncbi:hypothetical protein ACKWTF_001282 [Chironomus riparius]